MKKEKLSNINSIESDFRAEAIASGLISNTMDADKVLIIRHKGDKRGVSKDIEKIGNYYSSFDMMEYLSIYTNRESIYDSLPEGLFHQPSNSKSQKTKDDIIHEIRSHRNEELISRKFFQPFEMAIDKILVDAQAYEQKFDKAYLYSNLTDILKQQWTIVKHLSTRQALLFIKIIPILSEVSRDLDLIARVMGLILDCPVSICEGRKSKLELTPERKVKLKEWSLGINSVLGDSVEYENPDLVITVGPINLDKMKLFESKKKNDLILEELINLTIPFDRNVIIKYKLHESETKFRLSGKDHTAYLGINTTL
ncbi:type VI secretion system baseplate subunit TssG [Dysgonomonas sp. ZJ279]|uniref:type VI secretion system baseplate subunit TssG n=1 Tax=Dysgonomonas sp. ZJ279 TaxID=2709796 RepID=UPI0013ED5320|nr:type VI secretion system baseplate subunit TssG [Dysgonomonas sp. ZJ279]